MSTKYEIVFEASGTVNTTDTEGESK